MIIGFILSLSIQNSDSLIDRAVQLYNTRYIEMGYLQESFEMLKTVVESEPNNVRANYELAKVYSLLGDTSNTKNTKIKLYNKGLEYARRAIKLKEGSEWGHFWYMANMGKVGQLKGVLSSAKTVGEVRQELDRVLTINPRNTDALCARAAFYYELPGFLGGDLKKSIEDLNKGIAIDSNASALYVQMGRIYIKQKDYKKAEWFFKKVLAMEEPTNMANYVLYDRPETVLLMKKIGGKK